MLWAVLAVVVTNAEFIGFSRNNQVAAWRLAVRDEAPAIGCPDHFTLGVAQNVAQNVAVPESQTLFLLSPLAERCRQDDLKTALSQKQWQALLARGGFRALKLPMKDSTFRLRDLSTRRARIWADKASITIQAAPGQTLAYEPIVRLYDGRQVSLGVQEQAPSEHQSLTGHVTAFHSTTGYALATIHELAGRVWVQLTELPAPVGTHAIGTLNVIRENDTSVRRIFRDMHPSMARAFDRYALD